MTVTKNLDRLDPRDWGIKFDNVQDDTADWLSFLAWIDANYSGEYPEVALPYGRSILTGRITFPGSTSVFGCGAPNSQFQLRAPEAGVSLVNEDPTGQLTGTVPTGGRYSGFQVSGNTTQVGPLLRVGYCGHAHISNVHTRGGGLDSVGIQYWQTQESMSFGCLSSGCGDGYQFNRGANGNHLYGAVVGNSFRSQVRIGSLDTTSTGAVSNVGPGRNSFFGLIADRMADTVDAEASVVIESGRRNQFIGGRLTVATDVPLVWARDATETLPQQDSEFAHVLFRDGSANSSYVLEQDASAGELIKFDDCVFENLDSLPLFRTGGQSTDLSGSRFTPLTPAPELLHSGGKQAITSGNVVDYEVLNDEYGLVLTDRSTGQRNRVYLDAGSLQMEPA